MFIVTIGTSKRTNKDFSRTWLIQQIEERKAEGTFTGVFIEIESFGEVICVATPEWRSRSAEKEEPTRQQLEIWNNWTKRGLNKPGYEIDQLIAFLEQIR